MVRPGTESGGTGSGKDFLDIWILSSKWISDEVMEEVDSSVYYVRLAGSEEGFWDGKSK